ncbi:MAG: methyltransferase [Acidimicrobiaceae bacterium]|nr:methyltransferase [Acidimicrobiaceae bacterium]
MGDERWREVDEYLVAHLLAEDDALDQALARSEVAGLPRINVAANQGKLLELLATIHGARRILEIGTLGGYSTIWLARSLPRDGTLLSLELEAGNAEVARANIERAGLDSVAHVRVGPAARSMRELIAEGAEPFDFIFIDADKESYPEYLELSVELSRPGTVIVADNVVREGEVINPLSPDLRVQGIRRFLEAASQNDRLDGTAIQTVGVKGYDGFALFVVKA